MELYQGACFVVGEVAQAHDGSLGLAHAYIDAIARAGADAVKFQTHIAAAESTLRESWRVKFSSQDETRYDYWKRMELTRSQWEELATHARDRGLAFLSSPFSEEAFDLLREIGVDAWKVSSGEASNVSLLSLMTDTGLPILVSTGMSNWEEIDDIAAFLRSKGARFSLLQTTSSYPTPPDQIGLNVIGELRNRYGCSVGLSDHSGTVFPGLAAVTLGIDVLEIHVTLSREMFGPDVTSSITSDELRLMVDGIRFIEQVKAHPVDKDAMAESLEPIRGIFAKSVVARVPIPTGTVLSRDHLAVKKPGLGLPPREMPSLVGRRVNRAIEPDEYILQTDLD